MPQTYYEYSNTFLEDDIAYATDIATEFSAIETGLDALWADVPATVQTYVDAATTQATNAAASATAAALSEDVALAASNYAGIWADLVGALNVPASVYHGGGFWMLNSNLADVTLKEPGVDPEWTLIQRPDVIKTASGSITAGDPLVLNSNGTVSAITGTAYAAGSLYNISTAAGGAFSYQAICVIPGGASVVAVFRNSSDGKPYAIVGTISGTVITWGSATLCENVSTTSVGIAYDTTASKAIVCWSNSTSNFQRGAVGTIDVGARTISFGAVINVLASGAANVADTRVIYDSVNDKTIVVCQAGSDVYAVACSVSGTTLTAGSSLAIETSNTSTAYDAAYDSSNGAVFLTYTQISSTESWQSAAIIKITTGTTLQLQVKFNLQAAKDGYNARPIYDSTNNCFVVISSTSYTPAASSVYPSKFYVVKEEANGEYAIYESEQVYTDISAISADLSFDSDSGCVAVFYRDCAIYSNPITAYPAVKTGIVLGDEFELNQNTKNVITSSFSIAAGVGCEAAYLGSGKHIFLFDSGSNTLKSVIVTPEASSASIKNFIGFADTTAANNEDVVVCLKGGVNTNQSGLTVNSIYYLDYDGNLTTTNTGIMAGRALSTTSIHCGVDYLNG